MSPLVIAVVGIACTVGGAAIGALLTNLRNEERKARELDCREPYCVHYRLMSCGSGLCTQHHRTRCLDWTTGKVHCRESAKEPS